MTLLRSVWGFGIWMGLRILIRNLFNYYFRRTDLFNSKNVDFWQQGTNPLVKVYLRYLNKFEKIRLVLHTSICNRLQSFLVTQTFIQSFHRYGKGTVLRMKYIQAEKQRVRSSGTFYRTIRNETCMKTDNKDNKDGRIK